jgi:hypothetical protein
MGCGTSFCSSKINQCDCSDRSKSETKVLPLGIVSPVSGTERGDVKNVATETAP